MARLVVVSNRVADPRKSASGGLAVAVGQALEACGGLWVGWSGKIGESSRDDAPVHLQHSGHVQLATFDLTVEQHERYYLGYSNGVLWPVFHYRLDLANFDAACFDSYRSVNMLFAQKLLALLRPDDVIWIHDYHLIPLAAKLRALGCQQRMGFFLHIPLPPPLILAAIPQHAWLMARLFAYDVVGFQSQTDVQHCTDYMRQELGAQHPGNNTPVGTLEEGVQQFAPLPHSFSRSMRLQAFPIGMGVDEFTHLAQGKDAREAFATTREQYARRRLLIGIDRLDYSKGIAHRIRAFRELLIQFPENRDSATLIQIASPSRENVIAYTDIRHELEGLCGAINGDFGSLDWMPVRYIHRNIARKRLPGLCRAARVGLVTPLRDGMNLVAKEFVAAQDYADPGVLVLSRFAGAAEQLKEALLVNPYDIHGTAQTIQRALHMPLTERQERHQALLARIKAQDVHWWSRSFLSALNG